jgi:2'-5' RNA ligase
MPVAVELFLDEPSAAVVRQIWKDVAEAGVSAYLHQSGIRPHLTLAVGKDVDEPRVTAALEEWAAATDPFPVTFGGLGLTTGELANVYLTAIVTRNLLDQHEALQQRLRGLFDAPWERYTPGHWVPHCTLAERVPPDLLGRMLEVARRAPLPLTARLAEIGLVDFGPLRQRVTFNLYKKGVG